MLVFMCISYVDVIEGSALSVAVWLAILVPSFCVPVYVWDWRHLCVQMLEHAGGKAAATCLIPERGSRPLAPGLDSSSQAVESLGLLKAMIMLPPTVRKLNHLSVHAKACRKETCAGSCFVHWVWVLALPQCDLYFWHLGSEFDVAVYEAKCLLTKGCPLQACQDV